MTDPSVERAGYTVGARGMRGAPMGKSVFKLLRDARPDMGNMLHQEPQKQFGHEALPFKAAGPLGRGRK